MKKSVILFLFFASTVSFGQKKYAKKFNIMNDNDLYVSVVQDRYYTNGLFLSYNYVSSKENEKLHKKIYSIEVAQKMYTPFKANVDFLAQHDRPFAGYLYGNFGVRNFSKRNTIFEYSGQIGVIGPSALAEEAMSLIHDFYGFDHPIGWKYQIQNAFALNTNAIFTKNIQSLSSSDFDFNWKSEANLGTVFTDISTGFISRIGLTPLENIANSIGFDSNLNNEITKFDNNKEVFFYINPMLRWALYDATIQGSFLNENNIVTYEIKPIVFSTEVGFRFTSNRFNFKYSVTMHSKKLKSFRVPGVNFYASLAIGYLFN
ncbi:lipid A deacylase LpxR family protein [Tenacibaculum sp. M341]|uniref:lipid A deacylase LpxR family protein n=1 Tax=Tenacibaculum sp. M341 TaxID=2530339 RepID=UPI00345B8686